MSFCFGPPIYKFEATSVPGYGNTLDYDQNLALIVEAATTVWDQNHFDPSVAAQWDNALEQKDAQQWMTLLSREYRSSYEKWGYSERDWLNTLRHFLNQTSNWSKWWNGQTQNHGIDPSKGWAAALFDPVHWRIYNYVRQGGPHGSDNKVFINQFNGPFYDGGEGNWISYAAEKGWNDNLNSDYGALRYDYQTTDKLNNAFSWTGNWKTGQNASSDIRLPTPPIPPLEGFGVSQFLEWLFDCDYITLFGWEYGMLLIFTLACIAWTDFYPFFKEVGWVS